MRATERLPLNSRLAFFKDTFGALTLVGASWSVVRAKLFFWSAAPSWLKTPRASTATI